MNKHALKGSGHTIAYENVVAGVTMKVFKIQQKYYLAQQSSQLN